MQHHAPLAALTKPADSPNIELET